MQNLSFGDKLIYRLDQGKIIYWPSFLDMVESKELFNLLLADCNWEQGKVNLFGKEIPEPRLRCYFGEKKYVYTNSTLDSNPLPTSLLKLKTRIEHAANCSFNSVLINYYRDGKDSMGWHQDNEPELGKNPKIASLSVGEERFFNFKHIKSPEKLKIRLQNGSLLLMKNEIQHFYKHQLPKTKKIIGPRINLTFRKIL